MDSVAYNSYLEVDLRKLKANYERIERHIGPDVGIMPVLKANAYGLGAVELAKFYTRELGVKIIANAQAGEAAQLREAGIGCDLLVLGGIPFCNIPAAIEYDLQTTAFEREYTDLLDAEAARRGKTAEIHIKINTGMNRIGVDPGADLISFVRYLKTKRNIRVRGVYTHFAESGADDRSFSLRQLELFRQGLKEIKAEGQAPDYIHACNSDALVWFAEARYTHVRPGSMLFGYDNRNGPVNLLGNENALTWRCFVTQIKTLRAGDSLGYDRLFTAEGPTRVATISIGYGDGYFRPMMSAGGYALIGGKKCRFLGNAMDQSYLDVGGVPDIKLNNEVTLIGKDGNCEITPYDWRSFIGQPIGYMTSLLSGRVKRIYIK